MTEPPDAPGLHERTRVVAIASGKGGVGKSSLAANLAAALVSLGRATGILDADVYGYSIPQILGVHEAPEIVDDNVVPPVRNGLKVVSTGLLVDPESPLVWRGPMLHTALSQFVGDVHWGELDVLVVDMPPGTGDIPLSLGQLVPRAEVLVVTTPQHLAQQVALRAVQMVRTTPLTPIGVVENMSFVERESGREELFGAGGGAALAAAAGLPLLAQIPFDRRLGEHADAGEPVVWAEPDLPVSRAIAELARSLVS